MPDNRIPTVETRSVIAACAAQRACNSGETRLTYRRPRLKHAGMTMIEVMVASVLLVAAIGILAPATVTLARQRRIYREMFVGQQELANQMQRVLLPGTSKLKDGSLEVSPEHRTFLRNPELTLESNEGSEAIRVQLELSWETSKGFRVAPQRLTGWIPLDDSASESSRKEPKP